MRSESPPRKGSLSCGAKSARMQPTKRSGHNSCGALASKTFVCTLPKVHGGRACNIVVMALATKCKEWATNKGLPTVLTKEFADDVKVANVCPSATSELQARHINGSSAADKCNLEKLTKLCMYSPGWLLGAMGAGVSPKMSELARKLHKPT